MAQVYVSLMMGADCYFPFDLGVNLGSMAG